MVGGGESATAGVCGFTVGGWLWEKLTNYFNSMLRSSRAYCLLLKYYLEININVKFLSRKKNINYPFGMSSCFLFILFCPKIVSFRIIFKATISTIKFNYFLNFIELKDFLFPFQQYCMEIVLNINLCLSKRIALIISLSQLGYTKSGWSYLLISALAGSVFTASTAGEPTRIYIAYKYR